MERDGQKRRMRRRDRENEMEKMGKDEKLEGEIASQMERLG